MGNEEKITSKEFEDIKMLVDKATTASNKKTAEPFINSLDFMLRTLNIDAYKRIVFAELVSYVKLASGQVRDKEHWLGAVNQSLFKLEHMGDIK